MSILPSLTHHATLFIHPERKAFAESLWNELHSESLAHTLHEHTVLDIDTARSLSSWAASAYDGEKVALLSFHTITLPAQNALLKILEEPRSGVRFILVTSNSEALIPTLLSRLQKQSIDEEGSKDSDAKLFLSTKYTDRSKLSFITKLINAVDEEERKDREAVRTFILTLADIIGKHSEHSRYTLITLEMASYAGDPSASGKTIIDYLALLLPEIKA